MNTKNFNVGETKYFPSEFKEWNNNIYYYNNNYIKNFPVYDLNINKLIKDYFDLYLNRKYTKSKYRSSKKNPLSLNKIFVSKAEIKHTSSKAIITVYVYNREKVVLLKKYSNLKKCLFKLSSLFYKRKSKNKINFINLRFKYKIQKLFAYIKKNKLKLNINNLKFKDILLYKLSKLMTKFYNKKVEFNIVNLKSIVYNSSIFTEILRKKLIKRNANVLRLMNYILSKSIILEENNFKERIKTIKSINSEIIENKYKNLNVNSIVKNVNLNETIKDIYNIENQDNKDIIFNLINYKHIRGIRLEAKGRLTRRNRADRAIFKVKTKGGLKNIDSSYKGLSTVNYRGNTKSNLEYSMGISKRRVGAFAVKGWISGKR